MKIILLKDIPKVGKRWDTKDIADGYALNMLIPKGLAIAATADAVKRVALEKARTAGEEKVQEQLLVKSLHDIDGATVTITEKGNEKGHLFAGIHKLELIPKILEQTKVKLSPEYIVLDKPIKTAGDHMIEIKVKDKTAKFKLVVKVTK
ncbi:50S ribosomal protein L9 [bacterium]|nr:50S ribosomal protein L9 [bacterium]